MAIISTTVGKNPLEKTEEKVSRNEVHLIEPMMNSYFCIPVPCNEKDIFFGC